MKRFCLALDLKDDPKLIAAYKTHHKKVWPEVIASLSSSGIDSMDIFCYGNRLFMILVTQEDFDFNQKALQDAANPDVVRWEKLMWMYQQKLPTAKPNEKWVLMETIFHWKA